jgi:hypothetical protein
VECIHNDEDTKRKFIQDYKVKNKVELMVVKTDLYGCKSEGCKFELQFEEMNKTKLQVKTREKHRHNEANEEGGLPQHVKILMVKHLEKGKDNQALLQDLRAEVRTENLPNPRQITQKRYYEKEKKRAQLCELEDSRKSERTCEYETKSVPQK